MKKSLIAILALVLVLSLSLFVFVGCNKDGSEEENAAPSNAETLGTAVAVTAGYLSGGAGEASASSEETDQGSFKAGIDLTVNAFGIGGTISGAAEIGFDAISQIIEPLVSEGVSSISCYLNENGVTVGEVTSDDENFNKKYAVTVTYTDEETGESVTDEYALYLNVEGAEIESTQSYEFTAKIVAAGGFSFSFSGTASYSTEHQTTVFDLSVNVGGVATAAVKAYANTNGNICVEIGADVAGLAAAKVNIEIGKLGNDYGAKITVTATVNAGTLGNVDVTAVVSAVGGYDEATHSIALNGELDANLSILGNQYNANAALTGKAQYDSDKNAFEIGLTGAITLSEVEEEA